MVETAMTAQATQVESFFSQYVAHPNYHAPQGPHLHARTWQTEAPLRMLLNNLDADVAEDPQNLIVYGGTGQAARDPDCVKSIVRALLELSESESLLVQSGKPVAVLPTHPEAPRVLIANSNLVPHWATWEQFNALRERGLIMYGQMTAGSWIYIGSQGILQGTFETFAELARQHFNGSLQGRLVVSGGLGGMGGAQPLAATMNNAVFLGVDVNQERIQKRLHTRYLDKITESYSEAIAWVQKAREDKAALSVGLTGDIGTVLQRLIEDKVAPDVVTDQTSAHDPLHGYIPNGLSIPEAKELQKSDPQNYQRRSMESMARHVRAMRTLQDQGAIVFEYGNNLRQFAREGGADDSFKIPGFVPAYVRPLFCEGKGPFRWAALSGNPDDIRKTDEALLQIFPEDTHLRRWIEQATEKVAFQGLPARICWLGLGERLKAGLLFNQLVRDGVLEAPLVIGRDHLDCGSVASPFRETEAMKDGSDAISDWPLLNLMANCAGGATWVSFHHGGGVGMGYSQHAGMVVVADGTERAERCLRRVLHNDPALGVIRHADAGYSKAIETAEKAYLWRP